MPKTLECGRSQRFGTSASCNFDLSHHNHHAVCGFARYLVYAMWQPRGPATTNSESTAPQPVCMSKNPSVYSFVILSAVL